MTNFENVLNFLGTSLERDFHVFAFQAVTDVD
jgi:hypothetical protein